MDSFDPPLGSDCAPRTRSADDDAARALERGVLVERLARVARGDKAAFGRVYELTSAKIYALLVRMLRDEAAAEEILQDVYLTVWRRAATFDPDRASPITWLVTIARNKAIDRMRSRKGVRLVDLTDAEEAVDPAPSAFERLEDAERRGRLTECLDRLDSKIGAAIRAAFFDGLTYDMIAKRDGVPLSTMKSRIRRGLIRLKGCLER